MGFLSRQIGKQAVRQSDLRGSATPPKPKIPRSTIQEKARRIAEERGLIQRDPQSRQVASDKAFYEPSGEAQQIKRQYQKEYGLPTDRPPRISSLDTQRSRQIGDAFEEMEHRPQDPEVRAAYNQMGNESLMQYQKLLDAGVQFEYWRGRGEPYKSSQEMIDDVVNNRRLKVLATEGNFGQEAITPEQLAENPLLAKTQFTDPATGQPLLVNDVFRAVHDYFGHASEGTGFGAIGEEGAWATHMKMYSPLAQKALTTETRGQNSWVNFGRQMRRPDGTIPQVGDVDYIHPKDRPFGEQKIGLLPEEFTADEYFQLWNDPEFRNKAKQVGFVGATAYFAGAPEEAEGGIVGRAGKQAVKRAADLPQKAKDLGFNKRVYHATDAGEFDMFKNRDVGFHFAENPELAENAADLTGKRDPRAQEFVIDDRNFVEIKGQGNRFDYEKILDEMQAQGIMTEQEVIDNYGKLFDLEDKLYDQGYDDFEVRDKVGLKLSRMLRGKGVEGFKYWNEYDAWGEASRFKDVPEIRQQLESEGVQPDWSYIVLDQNRIRRPDAAFDPEDIDSPYLHHSYIAPAATVGAGTVLREDDGENY